MSEEGETRALHTENRIRIDQTCIIFHPQPTVNPTISRHQDFHSTTLNHDWVFICKPMVLDRAVEFRLERRWAHLQSGGVLFRMPKSAERSRKMHVASIDLLLMFVLFSAHRPVNLTSSPSLLGTVRFRRPPSRPRQASRHYVMDYYVL